MQEHSNTMAGLNSHINFPCSCDNVGNIFFFFALATLNVNNIKTRLSKPQVLCQKLSQTLLKKPNFLVWKFCGKAQFPHSFGQITPGNWVKLRYFAQLKSNYLSSIS